MPSLSLASPSLVTLSTALAILLEINVRFSVAHQAPIDLVVSILIWGCLIGRLLQFELILMVTQSLCILEVSVGEDLLPLLLDQLTLLDSLSLVIHCHRVQFIAVIVKSGR